MKIRNNKGIEEKNRVTYSVVFSNANVEQHGGFALKAINSLES